MPVIPPDQARRWFARCRVARLATVGPAERPHLVPVVFALDGDLVVMAVDDKPKRTVRLKRLANIAANPSVCLLADGYHEDWARLWWVRCDGRARVRQRTGRDADADRQLAALTAKYPRQYAEDAPRGPVIEVVVDRWSGWCAG